MSECLIRYRSSGGRGEFEWTQSDALLNKELIVQVPQYRVAVPTEVTGRRIDGKPRLRKNESNNREKLHIDGVVTALAKLPEPSRSSHAGAIWPLEGKSYVVDSIWCDIVDESATTVTLVPTRMGVRGSDRTINLSERFSYVAAELDAADPKHPALSAALVAFAAAIATGVNTRDLRRAANAVIDLQTEIFGPSNAGSTKELEKLNKLPPTDLEDAPEDLEAVALPAAATPKRSSKGRSVPAAPTKTEGKEGRLLTRWHAYRERDRGLVRSAKAAFKLKHGHLFCEACGVDPRTTYGDRGEDRLQAHHRTPIEEMIPGTTTKAEDLAMVCPNCHDIIHAKRPWISVEDVRSLLATMKAPV